jgi:hypothetical protein
MVGCKDREGQRDPAILAARVHARIHQALSFGLHGKRTVCGSSTRPAAVTIDKLPHTSQRMSHLPTQGAGYCNDTEQLGRPSLPSTTIPNG